MLPSVECRIVYKLRDHIQGEKEPQTSRNESLRVEDPNNDVDCLPSPSSTPHSCKVLQNLTLWTESDLYNVTDIP